MKKFFILLGVLIISSMMINGAMITVTNPHLDSVWYKGKTYNIIWEPSNVADTKVKIRLFKGSTKIKITDETDNDGMYKWKIPTGLADGSYVIRVKTLNNLASDDSVPFKIQTKKNFSLSKPNLTFKKPDLTFKKPDLSKIINTALKVTGPKDGVKLKYGGWLEIRWDTTPIKNYSQVLVELYSENGADNLGSINSLPDCMKQNSGKLDVAIEAKRYKTGKYRVRITTPDKKFSGLSGVFEIIPLNVVEKVKYLNIAAYEIHFEDSKRSNFKGCFHTMGSALEPGPSGTVQVGFRNYNDDPVGPCWDYFGVVYRAGISINTHLLGRKIVEARLLFRAEGHTQQLKLYRKKSTDDGFNAPLEYICSIDTGEGISVDITSVAAGWAEGKYPIRGLILKGSNENFDHNNHRIVSFLSDVRIKITCLEKE